MMISTSLYVPCTKLRFQGCCIWYCDWGVRSGRSARCIKGILMLRYVMLRHVHVVTTACLQDAVEDRVTVVLQSGEAVRVALPFAPAGPLPKLALDALHQVLPTGLFHSLATKHLLSPGNATRQLVCGFWYFPCAFW